VFEQPNLPLHSLANRATRAESWLLRIHNEVEQTFFAKKSQSFGKRFRVKEN
jgi:hypothetical protein